MINNALKENVLQAKFPWTASSASTWSPSPVAMQQKCHNRPSLLDGRKNHLKIEVEAVAVQMCFFVILHDELYVYS